MAIRRNASGAVAGCISLPGDVGLGSVQAEIFPPPKFAKQHFSLARSPRPWPPGTVPGLEIETGPVDGDGLVEEQVMVPTVGSQPAFLRLKVSFVE